VRLAVAATPGVAIPTLEAISKSEHELVAVITQPDRAAGRGKELRESEVGEWAKNRGFALLKPLESMEIVDLAKSVDCILTVGYGVLLPTELISIPKFGFLNLHFSLLPKWRGAAPVQRAIQAGDAVSGVTVFQLDQGMDTGPIYAQKSFDIPDGFRSADLFESLSTLGASAVMESLSLISGGAKPVPQTTLGSSKAKKISKEEARVNWHRASLEVIRDIRAFFPAPIAWTHFRGETIRIEAAQLAEPRIAPGKLNVVDGKLFAGTADGSIEILKVIPAGKKSLEATAWLNGARLTETDYFE
jgi:methionyl-tRNA formyltransferase